LAVVKYRVETFGIIGTQELETQLNSAGDEGWELIIEDDSGILVYKSSSPQIFRYKVAAAPLLFEASGLENFLQPFGDDGWELIAVSVKGNAVIFKQTQ
jgi:hypothetical protein